MRRAKVMTLRVTAATARGAAGALVALALLLAGCTSASTGATDSGSSSAAPKVLNVSAASSLKSVLTSTAPAFEDANGAKVAFNFGASGVLLKQIEGGAPADVFVSASPSQMSSAIAEGLISAESTVTFAGNDLVIMVPAGNPKGIHGPADLAKADKIATGDPALAPHGAKAQEWLTGLGLWAALQPKLVMAQNAAQTDDYVARREVDAAIGFASDAHGRSDIEVAYTVPAGQIKAIRYVAAPLKGAPDPAAAKAYVAYLLSPQVQKALLAAGFKPAP